jgi:hypothetical protein
VLVGEGRTRCQGLLMGGGEITGQDIEMHWARRPGHVLAVGLGGLE